MKVLWFEITTPSRYQKTGLVTAGWQDALENIVSQCKEIQLYVAFFYSSSVSIFCVVF